MIELLIFLLIIVTLPVFSYIVLVFFGYFIGKLLDPFGGLESEMKNLEETSKKTGVTTNEM